MTDNFLNNLNNGLEKILESGSLDEAKFTKNGLAKHYAKHVDHEDAPGEWKPDILAVSEVRERPVI